MPQEIGWSVEAKLLYQIKQLTRALNSRTYIATFPNFASFPNPGITGTLYVDEATGDIYVWNGTSYVLLSSGITALNGLVAAAQLLVTGSSGTDFNISSAGTTHTFNIPTASATNRGLLSSTDWTTFNNKQNTLTNPVTGTGTTNRVAKFTASGTVGDGGIADSATTVRMTILSGGNIGVNTTAPLGRFTVAGATSDILVGNNSTTGTSGVLRFIATGGDSYIQSGQAATSASSAALIFTAYGGVNERMRLTSAGRLLVGTSTEGTNTVDIAGNLRTTTGANFATSSGAVGIGTETINALAKMQINGNLHFDHADGREIRSNGTGTFRINNPADAGIVEINTGTTNLYQTKINVQGGFVNSGGAGSNIITFTTASTERMRITSAGNVLIGTTTDSGDRLRIAGDIQLTGSGSRSIKLDQSGVSQWVIQNVNTSGNLTFNNGAPTIPFFIEQTSYNIGISQNTFGTSATRTLAISTGVAPASSPADAIQMYSADITAGNAAPHFRTENGAVVKVYQETTGVGAATFVQGSVNAVYEDSTFDGYTLKQIVKALRNQGLLA